VRTRHYAPLNKCGQRTRSKTYRFNVSILYYIYICVAADQKTERKKNINRREDLKYELQYYAYYNKRVCVYTG